MQCSAKSKRSGNRCRRRAMKGKKVCMMHGGKSRAGALHPNFKHGLYSAYLPGRFAQLFESLEGRDLLDLSEDIKLLSTRILDVAQRVDAGESGARWKRALDLFKSLDLLNRLSDSKELKQQLDELTDLLQAGVSDAEAWEQIEELVVKKTKVVESQRKRAVEAHEMLAAQDARAMMRAITEGLKRAIEEHVTDPEVKRKVFVAASSEFARLVNSGRVELVSTANN